MVARFVPPAGRVGDERGEKPHQRPPFLHGAAEMVNGSLVGALGVGNRNPRLGQNAGCDRTQSRPDCRFRSQGVFFGHKRFYGAVHVVSMG